MVDEVEKLRSEVLGRRREGAVNGVAVVVVDTIVLMMQGVVEDPAAYRSPCKHAFDEWFELDVTVVEDLGDRAGKLNLVGLEAMA